jgi:putative redox protein
MDAKVVWQDEMSFDAELDGFHLTIDAAAAVGGRGLGPKPKGLLLLSLIGCTGMDVVAILKKMRVAITGLEVSARGQLAEEHPKKFEEIVVRYAFRGDELPPHKLRRAVQLSEERYCGVRATLVPNVRVRSEIRFNGETLADPPEA